MHILYQGKIDSDTKHCAAVDERSRLQFNQTITNLAASARFLLHQGFANSKHTDAICTRPISQMLLDTFTAIQRQPLKGVETMYQTILQADKSVRV